MDRRVIWYASYGSNPAKSACSSSLTPNVDLFVVDEVTQISPLIWSLLSAPGKIRTCAHGLGISPGWSIKYFSVAFRQFRNCVESGPSP
jgi:hypothetical protein